MSVGDHFQSPLRGATRPTPRPYSVPLLASYLPPPPSRSPFSGVQVRLLSCLLPASMLLSLRAFVSVAPPALEAPLGHSHSGSLTSFRPKVTPRGWS